MKRHSIAHSWDFHECDQWDCLYCEIARRCPYGKAVAELSDFCRLQESCPSRVTVECGEIASSEFEESLMEIYGPDAEVTADELAVYMRIHKWFG